MNKKIAIQMDPIEKIDYEFDTSFLLGKEAQNRGYDLFYYNPVDLEYENGSVFASGYFIELYDSQETYYKYLSAHKEKINLANFEIFLDSPGELRLPFDDVDRQSCLDLHSLGVVTTSPADVQH